jgi:phosphonate transport system substrate-binding protein
MRRRQFLLAAAGFSGTALLVACGSNNNNSSNNNKPAGSASSAAAPSASATAAATSAATAAASASAAPSASAASADLNAQGWPKSVTKLDVGLIPSEADTVQQKQDTQPLFDFISKGIGVPVSDNITTSYGALVEAQKNSQVQLGYYGPLSFLLAEQQFGAIPITVDSPDGKTPGNYHSLLVAGKNSGITTVADVKGKDFVFVDPASTSGYLFPIAMLKQSGIDPSKDIKPRFSGSHGNSILAIAKGQVPCGGTNDGNLQQAIDQGVVKQDDLVILMKSNDIPNGPFAIRPDLDKRAAALLITVIGQFNDPKVFKAVGLAGPLVPCQTSLYDYVRQVAKVINLQFDNKGNTIIPGAPTPAPTAPPSPTPAR